jgi:hypothetical protein
VEVIVRLTSMRLTLMWLTSSCDWLFPLLIGLSTLMSLDFWSKVSSEMYCLPCYIVFMC